MEKAEEQQAPFKYRLYDLLSALKPFARWGVIIGILLGGYVPILHYVANICIFFYVGYWLYGIILMPAGKKISSFLWLFFWISFLFLSKNYGMLKEKFPDAFAQIEYLFGF